jgi:hypothetical protein
MKRLIDYCFYRIASFYKKFSLWDSYVAQGQTLLVTALGFYTIALVNILLRQFGIAMTKEIIIIIFILLGIPLFFSKYFNNHFSEQLLEELQSKYEEERLKWLKGVLVFLFLIGSLVFMILSYYIK